MRRRPNKTRVKQKNGVVNKCMDSVGKLLFFPKLGQRHKWKMCESEKHWKNTQANTDHCAYSRSNWDIQRFGPIPSFLSLYKDVNKSEQVCEPAAPDHYQKQSNNENSEYDAHTKKCMAWNKLCRSFPMYSKWAKWTFQYSVSMHPNYKCLTIVLSVDLFVKMLFVC